MNAMPPSASFQGRRPPVSIESEQAVLGAVLLDNRAYQKAADIIAEEHFAEQVHRQIWHVVAGIIEKGDLATPMTAKTYLGDADLGGGQTVGQYLIRMATAHGVPVNQVADHAKIVRSLAARREIIAMTERVAGVAYDCPVEETAETIFANVERLIEETRPAVTKDQSDFEDFGGISSQDVFDAYQRGAGVVGLSTGLPALDHGMGGLRKSDLIILAGRPAMGKTALATNVAVSAAEYVAAQHAAGVRMGPVAFSSLEMSKKQLKQRILADRSRVPFWKLDRGIASEADMARYYEAGRAFQKLPLVIDDAGGLTIGQLKLRARTLKRRRGISLLVIDYLQLLSGSGRKDANRVAEVTEITTGLKALAKELDIPIIALSQLSRKVEDREDKRPQLADLRESGSIEQDADVVLFVYREDYYLKKAEPRLDGTDKKRDARAQWEIQMKRWTGCAEVIVGKNRHGSECTIDLGFDAQFTRFTNEPEPREIEPEEVRQRAAKKPTFTAEGTILYGILKSLTRTRSTMVTKDQRAVDRRLPPGARLIPLDVARQAFADNVMPGEPEQTVKNRFRAAFVSLSKAGIAFYQGVEETGFTVWLPEMSADLS
jgi:replicative DNA helicase